jgi:ubiquinone/menaquinone biosynthesis C-methylase UbiE
MTDAVSHASRWDPEGEEARNLRRRAESLWNRDYVERILVPLLGIPEGGHVVDVGTGFGALAFLLASVRSDLSITGVDPEAGLIEGARAAAEGLGLERLRFEVGDGALLPFASASLDLAMCQTVLTHVPDPAAVVAEMARVLRPGGIFLAAEWTDRSLGSFGFDNASTWPLDRAADTYRLTKAYSIGRARLGRGDDEAGIRAPILAADAGLEVVDVRFNDCVTFAAPPYPTVGQQTVMEEMRGWLDGSGVDDELVAWARSNLEAAGETDDDVTRWVEISDSPELRAPARQVVEENRLTWVSSNVMILTIARKPA